LEERGYMKKLAIVVLFLNVLVIKAQILEFESSLYNFFRNSNSYPVKPNGIGSYGFNSQTSNYNPTFLERENKILFNISGISNVKNARHGTDEDKRKYFKEIISFHPELLMDYQVKDLKIPGYNIGSFQLRLSHYQSLSRYNKARYGIGIFPGNIVLRDYEILISNSILQFSLIKKITNNLSLSGSILTNDYKYYFRADSYGTEKLRSRYFEQRQFISSINYYQKNIKIYALFKSQQVYKKLSPDRLLLLEKLFYPNQQPTRHVPQENQIPNHSVVSFPGSFAFGFQYTCNNRLKLSIENVNHYLFADKKVKIYNSSGNYYEEEFKHDSINPEIILGLNYSLSKLIQLGSTYSQFLKSEYNNNVISYSSSHGNIENNQFLTFSAMLNVKNMDISIFYQYSFAKIEDIYYYEFQSSVAAYKDYNHYLKLSLSYGLF
jgi:hypothetical protein